MRCILIRWDPENSDFSFDDLETLFDECETPTIPWTLPSSLSPQPGDLCLVCNANKDTGGYIAVYGHIASVQSSTTDTCSVTIDSYFVDTDCYPLFYASAFSDLSKSVDFKNGPEYELLDEDLIIAYHIIILKGLAKSGVIFLEDVDRLFTGEMCNITKALAADV